MNKLILILFLIAISLQLSAQKIYSGVEVKKGDTQAQIAKDYLGGWWNYDQMTMYRPYTPKFWVDSLGNPCTEIQPGDLAILPELFYHYDEPNQFEIWATEAPFWFWAVVYGLGLLFLAFVLYLVFILIPRGIGRYNLKSRALRTYQNQFISLGARVRNAKFRVDHGAVEFELSTIAPRTSTRRKATTTPKQIPAVKQPLVKKQVQVEKKETKKSAGQKDQGTKK